MAEDILGEYTDTPKIVEENLEPKPLNPDIGKIEAGKKRMEALEAEENTLRGRLADIHKEKAMVHKLLSGVKRQATLGECIAMMKQSEKPQVPAFFPNKPNYPMVPGSVSPEEQAQAAKLKTGK